MSAPFQLPLRTWRTWLLLLLLVSAGALAWETYVDGEETNDEWKSIYYLEEARTEPGKRTTSGAASGKTPPKGFTENEHREQAYITLNELGVGELAIPRDPLHVLDLNASLYRPEVANIDTVASEPRSTLYDPHPMNLQRRRLPAPAQFAGLPDFSYSMYDWINKNHYCPALPANAPMISRCHMFTAGWLSALNSSHFGTQATKNYKRLHTVALGLAERARTLREQIEKADPSGAATTAYREYIREAEWMALAYEGVAQHFLQDRLAIGHMWERWGSANWQENGELSMFSFVSLVALGAAVGLVHGSETVTLRSAILNNNIIGGIAGLDVPDPLSSPIIHRGEALPAEFKIGNQGPYRGVGDHRLVDMYRGQFGGEYTAIGKDYPMALTKQPEMLRRCTQAGWSSIILELGQSKSGGYGLNGLKPNVETQEIPSECFDGWATNRSLALAVLGDKQYRAVEMLRLTVDVARIAASLANRSLPSFEMVDSPVSRGLVLYRIRKEALRDPNGTSLAKGELGPYGNAKTGNHYTEAAYLEPRNIQELPEADERGRDKRAVFGFFNRAHTDHWCERLPTELEKLRGKPMSSRERSACVYLADRAFNGTDPRYKGMQTEKRTVDGKRASAEVKPICEILGKAAFPEGSTPASLAPGYVSSPDARPEEAGPYSRTYGNMTYKSVENWCGRRPILHLLMRNGELDKDDVVAEVDKPSAVITLNGADLGGRTGELTLRGKDGMFKITDFESWSDNQIRFRLPKDKQKEGGAYFVTLRNVVETSGGSEYGDKRSAGRFVVRVADEPEEECVCPKDKAAPKITKPGKKASGKPPKECKCPEEKPKPDKTATAFTPEKTATGGGDCSTQQRSPGKIPSREAAAKLEAELKEISRRLNAADQQYVKGVKTLYKQCFDKAGANRDGQGYIDSWSGWFYTGPWSSGAYGVYQKAQSGLNDTLNEVRKVCWVRASLLDDVNTELQRWRGLETGAHAMMNEACASDGESARLMGESIVKGREQFQPGISRELYLQRQAEQESLGRRSEEVRKASEAKRAPFYQSVKEYTFPRLMP